MSLYASGTKSSRKSAENRRQLSVWNDRGWQPQSHAHQLLLEQTLCFSHSVQLQWPRLVRLLLYIGEVSHVLVRLLYLGNTELKIISSTAPSNRSNSQQAVLVAVIQGMAPPAIPVYTPELVCVMPASNTALSTHLQMYYPFWVGIAALYEYQAAAVVMISAFQQLSVQRNVSDCNTKAF